MCVMFVYAYMCVCACVCGCMHIVHQVSQVDHDSLQATALRVVFDLLHLYGFESFNMDGGDCTGEDYLEEEVDGKKQNNKNIL